MKPFTKLLKFAVIGAAITIGLAGCDLGGCKGDGACYYIRANNDYKWCGDEGCAVWKSEQSANYTSISCNCE